jgi:hypothetical protein
VCVCSVCACVIVKYSRSKHIIECSCLIATTYNYLQYSIGWRVHHYCMIQSWTMLNQRNERYSLLLDGRWIQRVTFVVECPITWTHENGSWTYQQSSESIYRDFWATIIESVACWYLQLSRSILLTITWCSHEHILLDNDHHSIYRMTFECTVSWEKKRLVSYFEHRTL